MVPWQNNVYIDPTLWGIAIVYEFKAMEMERLRTSGINSIFLGRGERGETESRPLKIDESLERCCRIRRLQT
jgi:hypothetical protein